MDDIDTFPCEERATKLPNLMDLQLPDELNTADEEAIVPDDEDRMEADDEYVVYEDDILSWYDIFLVMTIRSSH